MEIMDLSGFSWKDVFELLVTAIFFVVGMHIKDSITHATNKNKIHALKEELDEFKLKADRQMEKHDLLISETNKTLTQTNITLGSLDATVRGLAEWLKRVDERH